MLYEVQEGKQFTNFMLHFMVILLKFTFIWLGSIHDNLERSRIL